jgi:transcription elongation factor Elf1
MRFINKPGTVARKKEIAEVLQRHKQHFGGFMTCLRCNVEPKLRYTVLDSGEDSFTFHCSECGFTANEFENLQAAITCWYVFNRREHHTRVMWNERYQEQIAERQNDAGYQKVCVNDN